MQWRMHAVHFGADRRVADIGMHEIGKIDGRRAARKRDEIALGREAKHLILIEAELGMLIKLLGIGALLEQVHHIAKPFEGAHGGRVAFVDLFAITPMGRHAAFGDVVHVLCADLYFYTLIFRTHDGRVDRAIAIGFG
jgi:hypothetical protein